MSFKNPKSGFVIVFVVLLSYGLTLQDLNLPVTVRFSTIESKSIIEGNITKMITVFAGLAGITSILFSIFNSWKKDEGFLLTMFKEVFLLQVLAYFASIIFFSKIFSDVLLPILLDDGMYARIAVLTTSSFVISILLVVFMFYRLVSIVTSGSLEKRYFESLAEISSSRSEKELEQQRKKRRSLINNLIKAITDKDKDNFDKLIEVYKSILLKHTESLVAGDPVQTLYDVFIKSLEGKNRDCAHSIIIHTTDLIVLSTDQDKHRLVASLLTLPRYFYEGIRVNGFEMQYLTHEVSGMLKGYYRILSSRERTGQSL